RPRSGEKFLAWLVGSLSLAIGTYWIKTVSWAGMLATVAIEGCFYPFVLLGARALHRRLKLPLWLAWPLAWTGIEFLRGRVPFGGFPWMYLGHAVHELSPVIQIADLAGASLISLVVALLNGAIVWTLLARRRPLEERPPQRRAWLTVVVVWVAVLVYGFVRPGTIETHRGPTIAAVQPNIPQYEKNAESLSYFETNRRITVDLMEGATEAPDLVVWSETMLHLVELGGEIEHGQLDAQVIRPLLETRGTWLLSGANIQSVPSRDAPPETYRFTNSALLFDPQARLRGRYDKMSLVPGGEAIPLPKWLGRDLLEAFIEKFVVGQQWTFLEPGTREEIFELPTETGPVRFGATICYENVHPWVGRALTRKGAELLVNISNEAWFLDSLEMDQMIGMTKIRAIETRRSIFRATNSGISCLVDPLGRVIDRLERGDRAKEVQGTFTAQVPTCRADTLFLAIGSSWAWALAGLVLGLGVAEAWAARRRKRAARES
ncbi:MAG: apolipoprotein N-acyltransferase, partial [Planctomycetota bacterium]